MVKIGLKQEEEEERVVTEVLLDSGAIGLVMSKEFAKKYRFRKTKLERLIYVRNVNGMLNYIGPIVDTVEVEIFFKGHKEEDVDRCNRRLELECYIGYALASTP